MDLIAVARETLSILAQGRYRAPSGRSVTLDLSRCVPGTRTWRPAELEPLVAAGAPGHSGRGLRPGRPQVEVTGETSAAAARRLAAEGDPPLVLNFASAVSVGGGFLRGARAQEEDLCRASALYACLEPQRTYYAANRAAESELYTDHMILSPAVPFFRDDGLALLEAPFLATVLTAPAPCARRLSAEEVRALPATLERRVARLLGLCAALGQRRLVLGAWGCGAFRNDPTRVAEAFARALERQGGAFQRVVFAVWDPRPEAPNRRAFQARLLSAG